MYVPPESRMKTSAWKQRASHILLPPGLWAEQDFAAAPYAFKWKLLPPASSNGELCSLLLPLYTWKWLIYWESCSGTVTITQAYKYNAWQSGSSLNWILQGCEHKSLMVQMSAQDLWLLGHALFWDTRFIATRRGSGSPAQPATRANFFPSQIQS